jgi:cobalt/nickel transport system ATP-binding protein
LSNIEFSVSDGACVGIAGANGSGKSTLLQIISGCIKPDSGAVEIDGVSVYQKTRGKKQSSRPLAGMVFQEPDNQLFMPTVWEDVAFSLMVKGEPPLRARERALAALELLDAAHLAERAPHTLSGGEKQRAAIAGALAGVDGGLEKRLLAIDEPTAALDPRARKNLIALLKRLPCTRIIATHDLGMAQELCDEVIFLHQGCIAARSPVPGLLRDDAFLQSIALA